MICPVHNVGLAPRPTRFGALLVCPVPECDIRCSAGNDSTPADRPTREARKTTYKLLERLKSAESPHRRRNLRSDLATFLDISPRKCHVGRFDIKACASAVTWALARLRRIK